MEEERARLGLDQPVWKQFVDWIWGLVRLDFGLSMWTGAPDHRGDRSASPCRCSWPSWRRWSPSCSRFRWESLAALKQDTWIDYAIRVFSIAGLATPSFWLGILMFLVLSDCLPVDPADGVHAVLGGPWQNLSQLIWPALAVGYRYSAVATRMTRSAMLEVLREDYIRTARAKGCG